METKNMFLYLAVLGILATIEAAESPTSVVPDETVSPTSVVPDETVSPTSVVPDETVSPTSVVPAETEATTSVVPAETEATTSEAQVPYSPAKKSGMSLGIGIMLAVLVMISLSAGLLYIIINRRKKGPRYDPLEEDLVVNFNSADMSGLGRDQQMQDFYADDDEILTMRPVSNIRY